MLWQGEFCHSAEGTKQNYRLTSSYQNNGKVCDICVWLGSRHKMTEEDRVGLINEIDILKQVDHPNIVKLIDVYEDDTTFSLVLELMLGGEVSS